MKDIFKNAEWITASSASAADEHRCYNYFEEFSFDEPVATLYISAFSQYAVWVNGEFCDTDVFEDYDFHPNFDTLDISRFCKRGRNTLVVGQYVCGADFSTCSKGIAGVIFAVYGSEKCVCASSTETLSARDTRFLDAHEPLSPQLGFNFEFDARALLPEPKKSIPVNKTREIVPRPIEKCVIGSLKNGVPVSAGGFREKREAPTKAVRMANADIDFRPLGFVKNENGRYNATVDTENCDGLYFLFDLGGETTGYLSFSASVPSGTEILVGFGEHAENGRVPCSLALLNCCFRFIAKEGKNDFFLPYRRLGLRFLQVHIFSKTATLENVGIAPSEYPLSVYPCPVSDERLKKIYEVGIKTLRNCMHTHYEDCPWREQSLYSLDSRTQMLCGYAAFADGNAKFVRSRLDLISRSERPDGLLTLCAPAGIDRPIPCYSLSYIMQMKEYGDFSGDAAFLESKLDLLERIASVFLDRRASEHGGAVRRLPDRLGYWNFYEWAKTLDGRSIHKETADADLPAEAPLTAFLAMACRDLGAIFELCAAKNGEKADVFAKKAEYYRAAGSELAAAIRNVFFDADAGLFRSFTDRADAPFAVLTQALCLLAGAGEGTDTSRALEAVAVNGGEGLVPATLSSSVFRFDALAAADAEKYAPVILAELDRDGKYMLDRGATTFWETIKGAADFGGAGSLCHGWSALAALWYTRLEAHVGC